ncbi:hypothetical protein P692DRAFT_20736259, partial [Suillus brevipes Sb2]
VTAIPSFRKNRCSRYCLPSACELVRSIVFSIDNAIVGDIYNLALKQRAIQLATEESPEHNVPKKEHSTIVRRIKRQHLTRPPHPEHPVLLYSEYLKRVVLPDLVNSKKVESSAQSELLGLPRLAASVREDWSHLNK